MSQHHHIPRGAKYSTSKKQKQGNLSYLADIKDLSELAESLMEQKSTPKISKKKIKFSRKKSPDDFFKTHLRKQSIEEAARKKKRKNHSPQRVFNCKKKEKKSKKVKKDKKIISPQKNDIFTRSMNIIGNEDTNLTKKDTEQLMYLLNKAMSPKSKKQQSSIKDKISKKRVKSPQHLFGRKSKPDIVSQKKMSKGSHKRVNTQFISIDKKRKKTVPKIEENQHQKKRRREQLGVTFLNKYTPKQLSQLLKVNKLQNHKLNESLFNLQRPSHTSSKSKEGNQFSLGEGGGLKVSLKGRKLKSLISKASQKNFFVDSGQKGLNISRGTTVISQNPKKKKRSISRGANRRRNISKGSFTGGSGIPKAGDIHRDKERKTSKSKNTIKLEKGLLKRFKMFKQKIKKSKIEDKVNTDSDNDENNEDDSEDYESLKFMNIKKNRKRKRSRGHYNSYLIPSKVGGGSLQTDEGEEEAQEYYSSQKYSGNYQKFEEQIRKSKDLQIKLEKYRLHGAAMSFGDSSSQSITESLKIAKKNQNSKISKKNKNRKNYSFVAPEHPSSSNTYDYETINPPKPINLPPTQNSHKSKKRVKSKKHNMSMDNRRFSNPSSSQDDLQPSLIILEQKAIIIQSNVRGYLSRVKLEKQLESMFRQEQENLLERATNSPVYEEREPSVILTYGLRTSKKKRRGQENPNSTGSFKEDEQPTVNYQEDTFSHPDFDKLSKTQKGFFVQKSREDIAAPSSEKKSSSRPILNSDGKSRVSEDGMGGLSESNFNKLLGERKEEEYDIEDEMRYWQEEEDDLEGMDHLRMEIDLDLIDKYAVRGGSSGRDFSQNSSQKNYDFQNEIDLPTKDLTVEIAKIEEFSSPTVSSHKNGHNKTNISSKNSVYKQLEPHNLGSPDHLSQKKSVKSSNSAKIGSYQQSKQTLSSQNTGSEGGSKHSQQFISQFAKEEYYRWKKVGALIRKVEDKEALKSLHSNEALTQIFMEVQSLALDTQAQLRNKFPHQFSKTSLLGVDPAILREAARQAEEEQKRLQQASLGYGKHGQRHNSGHDNTAYVHVETNPYMVDDLRGNQIQAQRAVSPVRHNTGNSHRNDQSNILEYSTESINQKGDYKVSRNHEKFDENSMKNELAESKEFNSFSSLEREGGGFKRRRETANEKWVNENKIKSKNLVRYQNKLTKMGSTPLVELQSSSRLFEDINRRNDEKLLKSSLNSLRASTNRSRGESRDSSLLIGLPSSQDKHLSNSDILDVEQSDLVFESFQDLKKLKIKEQQNKMMKKKNNQGQKVSAANLQHSQQSRPSPELTPSQSQILISQENIEKSSLLLEKPLSNMLDHNSRSIEEELEIERQNKIGKQKDEIIQKVKVDRKEEQVKQKRRKEVQSLKNGIKNLPEIPAFRSQKNERNLHQKAQNEPKSVQKPQNSEESDLDVKNLEQLIYQNSEDFVEEDQSKYGFNSEDQNQGFSSSSDDDRSDAKKVKNKPKDEEKKVEKIDQKIEKIDPKKTKNEYDDDKFCREIAEEISSKSLPPPSTNLIELNIKDPEDPSGLSDDSPIAALPQNIEDYPNGRKLINKDQYKEVQERQQKDIKQLQQQEQSKTEKNIKKSKKEILPPPINNHIQPTDQDQDRPDEEIDIESNSEKQEITLNPPPLASPPVQESQPINRDTTQDTNANTEADTTTKTNIKSPASTLGDALLDQIEDNPLSNAGEEESESTGAETVYGIRTNFNAVNEYLSLLLKFLREKGIYFFPRKKNEPHLILKKANILHEDLKSIAEGPQNIIVPVQKKRSKKRKKAEDKCFNLKIGRDHYLLLKNFQNLESEILSNYQDMNIMEELFDMQKIYHRAIYDCFNEGISKHIFEHDLSFIDAIKPRKKRRKTEKFNDLLEHAKEHVLDAASLLCGIIKDKEDSMIGNIRFMEDDFISQLREERMYRMITFENIEREKYWQNKEAYAIIIKKEIAQEIEERLINEIVADLADLRTGNRPKNHSKKSTIKPAVGSSRQSLRLRSSLGSSNLSERLTESRERVKVQLEGRGQSQKNSQKQAGLRLSKPKKTILLPPFSLRYPKTPPKKSIQECITQQQEDYTQNFINLFFKRSGRIFNCDHE